MSEHKINASNFVMIDCFSDGTIRSMILLMWMLLQMIHRLFYA